MTAAQFERYQDEGGDAGAAGPAWDFINERAAALRNDPSARINAINS